MECHTPDAAQGKGGEGVRGLEVRIQEHSSASTLPASKVNSFWFLFKELLLVPNVPHFAAARQCISVGFSQMLLYDETKRPRVFVAKDCSLQGLVENFGK